MTSTLHRITILFIALVWIATPVHAQKKPVTINDVFGNREFFGGRSPSFKWLKDGTSYTVQKTDSATKAQNIWKVDARTGKEELLVDLSQVSLTEADKPFRYMSYDWSSDESHIIFTLSQKQIWRRSTTGTYAIYNVKQKKLTPLPEHATGVRNVKLSPNGKWVGYVHEDNIWVFNFETGTELQLTSDAEEYVYNGRFGWVYEEEFSIVDGWMWSPDSKRIAFWQEDERQVPEYRMTDWDPLYLEFESIRYPKAGDKNPIERIGVIDVAKQKTTWVDTGAETDIYIPRMFWTNDPNLFFIYRLNRLQNHLEVLAADATTGKTRLLFEEKSAGGWVDVEHSCLITFLKSKKQFLYTSERDGWNHIYLMDYNGKVIRQITKGQWEVTNIEGLTPDERTLCYVSTEISPMERHLYRIGLDGKGKKQLTAEAGYHSINMSPTCALYVDSYSSAAKPQSSHLIDASGTLVKTLAEMKTETYEKYRWSPKEFLTITTSDGLALNCSMIKPPDFDPNRKYPVYFDVYGGPGSQNVRNTWPSTSHEWIANEGFIVFQIDNRGTGFRGTDFKFRVYKQLGKWEAHDYVEAAKYLGTLPYVDKANIGIWGWSYGGYMAALTLMLGAEYFKAAVAIAPVTDWKFYDTIYTERFMQTPELNPDGYKVGSCLEHAEKLKGRLLLVHGGQDDNVHLQNAMQLSQRLIEAGKQFDMRVYPKGNHGMVSSMKERTALFEYFMLYMKRNLQGDS